MEVSFISNNISAILIVLAIVLLVWNVRLELKLKKESQRITHFFKGEKAESLEEVISQALKKQRKSETDLQEITKKVKELEKTALKSLQNIEIVRFNPFRELGGNQSFSLVALDKNKDGVVISSYHSKETSRVYAKPVKQGSSDFPLSKEEEKVIEKAVKTNDKS